MKRKEIEERGEMEEDEVNGCRVENKEKQEEVKKKQRDAKRR